MLTFCKHKERKILPLLLDLHSLPFTNWHWLTKGKCNLGENNVKNIIL